MSESPVTNGSFSALLSNIVDNRGKTCPTASDGIALIATNCIKNENLYPVYENVRYVSEETYKNWFRGHPIPGDFIFVTKGTPGQICLVPSKVDFCIAQDMVAIRADSKKVDPKYLFAVLRSPDIQGEIENLHVGTLIPHFKKGDFGKLLIPLPRKELQEYIGEQYFLFSAKIDLLHRQNKTLEGMAEALWRKMFVEGAKTDWPTKQLKDLCTITRGASPRPIIEYVKDGTVPWIKIADATASGSYFIDRTNEFIIEAGVSKSVKVSPGDLILSNSATCGFPYFVELEGCIHDGWLLFRNFMGISKLFVFFFLKQLNEELNYIADGSVQNNLNTGLLKEYKLKAPPFNLVKDFDDFGEIAVTRIRKNTIQIRTLSRLRDTLLPKLMSGEVRVKL